MPPRFPRKKRPAKKTGPRRKAKVTSSKTTASEGVRLQKVLAEAGLGSRRQCEELITAGRVEVDRELVIELGTRVDPGRQEIRVDGESLRQSKLVYYAVNKPTGVVSTNSDPAGRPRVIDLLPRTQERLFPIGRLDMNSEGLILVTNDGDLANRLTHPRYEIEKTYRVMVAGHPAPEMLRELRKGVRLAEGVARVEDVRLKSQHKQSAILEMVLREGKNREIRRVFARVGHKVMRLVRIAVGPIRLGSLSAGEARSLTRQEVDALWKAARATPVSKKQASETAASEVAASETVATEMPASKTATPKTATPKRPASKRSVSKRSVSKRHMSKRSVSKHPMPKKKKKKSS